MKEKREKETEKVFSPLGVVFLICISDNSEHLDSCHLRKACSWQSATIYDNNPYSHMTGPGLCTLQTFSVHPLKTHKELLCSLKRRKAQRLTFPVSGCPAGKWQRQRSRGSVRWGAWVISPSRSLTNKVD